MQATSRPEPAIDSATRASLAHLIAHFLLHEIDPPGLGTLRQPGMLETLDKLEPGCSEYLSREWQTDDFEQAAVDYCSLFVLPRGAPPFAGAWLGGAPQEHSQRLLAQIHGIARQLDTEPGFANLPVDHFGLLLPLLAEAWLRDHRKAVDGLRQEILEPTIPAFAAACRQRTRNPLYRALASLLGQLFSSS